MHAAMKNRLLAADRLKKGCFWCARCFFTRSSDLKYNVMLKKSSRSVVVSVGAG